MKQSNLTYQITDDIIHKHLRIGSCGGIGRRNGLKIRRSKIRTGSSPVTSTTSSVTIEYRGVEQLVACRAHNPEVVWFESRLRNQLQDRNGSSGFLLYNFSMIHVFAAIDCEVKALRHLVSDDLEIVLTGIGKVNAAFAVGRTFHKGFTRQDLASDVIINIGTCGSYDLHGLFLINKITDDASGKDYYPDILRVKGLPEAPLITVGKVKTDPEPGCLYDMEASAVYQAGSKLISPDRMIFLKMVSDNGDVGGVTEASVNALVESYVPKIEELISKVREGITPSCNKSNEDLYDLLKASASMKVQIDELMRFAESMGMDGRKLFDEAGASEVTSRAGGKEVTARVRSVLTHLS